MDELLTKTPVTKSLATMRHQISTGIKEHRPSPQKVELPAV
jgi:hypothetical protein